jgi:hypothetical protein
MSKRFVMGLSLVGLAVLILLLNSKGNVSIEFVLFELTMLKSVAFLVFIGVGVFIGALLR